MRVRGSDRAQHCVVPASVGISGIAVFVLDESHLEADWNNDGDNVPMQISVTSDPLSSTGFSEADTGDGTDVINLSDPVEPDTDYTTVFKVQDTCGNWVEIARYVFNSGD